MKHILLTLAALSIIACQADELDTKVADTKTDCGAAQLQNLVGQDQSTLEGMSFDAQNVRIITPGTMITMDHLETRLNIAIGEDGKITRVYCG